jgi:purine-binding chemotaxis protein CheW
VKDQANTYILFSVAETTYALPSENVRHMEMVEQITPVPKAPAYIDGVVFSRGQIVPVVNVRARFGFDRVPHDVRTRLLVVHTGDRAVALLVDSAREFVVIPRASIQPPGNGIAGLSGQYLTGFATLDDRLVLMLDLDELLGGSMTIDAGAAGEPSDAAAPL